MTWSKEESYDWIRSRRSVFPKEFEEERVPREEVEELLSVARWAPTHKQTEPWRFVVFMDDAKDLMAEVQATAFLQTHGETEETLAKAAKFRFIAERSSAVVAVVMRRDPQRRLPVYEEEWAVACAVQNVHLHARSLKIGMYWSTGAARGIDAVTQHVGLGEDDVHMGWLYIGRYAGQKYLAKERLTVDAYVTWR